MPRRRRWQGTREPLKVIPVAELPSAEEIDAAKKPGGSWNRGQLAEWGVPWPPPKRWRKDLLQRRVVAEIYSTREGIAATSRAHGTGCPCDCCLAAEGDDQAWARVREMA